MKRPTSVLLLGDLADTRIAAERDRLIDWLRARGVRAQLVRESTRRLDRRAGLAIVLGGDGAFLRAARRLEGSSCPLIGIRLGSFGYLAELEPENWEPELKRLLEGKGSVEHWMRLACRIRRAGRPDRSELALNEVAVTSARVARILTLNLRIDSEDISQYRGDGLIVASPVGSTAYSMAAGGPIIEPRDRCLLLTPLTAHALTFRPLVLNAERRVELKVGPVRSGAAVTLDGREPVELRQGDIIEVRASSKDLRVASIVDRSRFRTLRERLHWGAPLVETS